MDPSLAESIERARRGDRRAFDAVVEAWARPLVRFAATVMAGDMHAAQDVVQEAFLAAWRALPSMEQPRFLRAWLYRVAYRRAVSWLRRRGPRGEPFLGLDDSGGGACADPPARDDPGAASARGDGAAAGAPLLRAALVSLPEHYSTPITLYYLESLDLRETARVLGLSVPTLKMRLHRGRALLKDRLLAKEPWTPHRTRRPHPGAATSLGRPRPGSGGPGRPSAPGAPGSSDGEAAS